MLDSLKGHRINNLLTSIHAMGGTAYFVGGSVRDHLISLHHPHLNVESKDLDVEVYGLHADTLKRILEAYGTVSECGQSFAVMKLDLDGEVVDMSLPRRDSKKTPGHKGFVVEYDPHMHPRDASRRRNFTINSAMINGHTGELLDFHGASRDIGKGIIRPVCYAHYHEDPLRNLIGLQQSVRFGFTVGESIPDQKMYEAAMEEFEELSDERIWTEWKKLFSKGKHFGVFFQSLESLKLTRMYPELASLIRLPQDPEWHPEGSADIHSELAASWMADYCDKNGISGQDRIVMVAAALLHDIGKPLVTAKHEDGHIRSIKHDKVAVEDEHSPAITLMNRMRIPPELQKRIIPLIREHMALIGADIRPTLVRRLSARLSPATVAELDAVIQADHASRPPLDDEHPFPDLMRVAEELKVTASAPAPILMGRHLISVGVKPGPEMGEMLRRAYDAQLDGDIVDIAGGLQLLGLCP